MPTKEMKCEAEGKILYEFTPVRRITKDGKDWERRDYVMETSERYHSKMRFSMTSFEGPVDSPLSVGDVIRLRFVVEAFQKENKWYNNVKALSIERL